MKRYMACAVVLMSFVMVAGAQQQTEAAKEKATKSRSNIGNNRAGSDTAPAPANPQTDSGTAGTGPYAKRSKSNVSNNRTTAPGGTDASNEKNINTSEDNLGSGKGGVRTKGTGAPAPAPAKDVKPASEHGSGMATGK